MPTPAYPLADGLKESSTAGEVRRRISSASSTEQYPVKCPARYLCTDEPSSGTLALFVKFFTESLILAQDERWRRA